MAAKILIIEDHRDFRETLKGFLKSQNSGFEIFESPSAEIGVELALDLRPEVILMDIRLPKMHGIDAADVIKKRLPECGIIVLTMFETNSFREVFKSDAVAEYLGKSELYEKLMPAIRKVLEKNNN